LTIAVRKFSLCSSFFTFWFSLFLVLLLFAADRADAAGSQALKVKHVPDVVARLTPLRPLASDKRIKLAIGLPLRDEPGLDALLREQSDPVSPSYRQWLTPQEFTERFGPSVEDYSAVEAFASAHNLTVTHRHPNRVVLDVEGTVGELEAALHTHLSIYQHPSENREFYAPDAEPTLDLGVRIVDISGLDNFSVPKPKSVKRDSVPDITPRAGSGPSGSYMGNDFRAAYVPGTTLTGAGQTVGLLQFDGFYPSDITAYASQAGLANPNVIVVPIDGGVSTPGGGNSEVALDIEMVMSMAPGVSAIYVYEAPNPSPWVDLLSRMANDNLSKQLSCSWGGGGVDASAEAIFKQMSAQGQSFYNASGDSDAFTTAIPFPSDSTNITQVGGTTLSTGAGGAYSSETVWNWGLNQGKYVGSSGGVSTYYGLPVYQQGISMVANQGATTLRNIPDVALTGDNVYVRYNNGGAAAFGGTSCAAPLWAGLTALINQQAGINGINPVGFMNPPVYAIGKGTNYATCFNDITVGNNFNSSSPTKYSAVAGYDLCTGWGTPKGNALITALAGLAAPFVVADTYSIASESCVNNAVDPGETVTLLIALKNSGSANATNVVATLQASGGVTAPSAPQSYGALAAGGASVSKPFTFTASGICGAALTLTLALQDGTQNLGTAQFNLHLGQITPGVTLTQNFDSVVAPALPSNWASAVVSGSASPWMTTNGGSFSAPNAAFAPDVATAGVNALMTPVVFIATANPQLSFRQNYNLHLVSHGKNNVTYYDGGVLELKIDNGAFTEIVAAGGSFVSGAYNCTLATGSGNAYGGSQAWGGSSGGWNNVTVNLPASVVGHNVQLRWVLATDSGNAGSTLGWFIDDISVQGGAFVCCNPNVTLPPSITTQPSNQVAIVGSNVSFVVAATGTAPLTYQWQRGGTNLANGTASTLSLLNVQTNDAAAYRVVITNSAGTLTSAVANLTVLVPPAILTQPTNRTVVAGTPVSFIAAASGTAPLAYQWYFNTTNKVGTNGPAFGLANAQPTNDSPYRLVVSNAAGMATSSIAVLTVLSPPAITLQPSNATVVVGQNLALHTLATGSAPLSYQWYLNNTTLVGTNGPDLGFANIQPSAGGAYKVVVTNSAGVATSSVATITVLVPPSFTLQPTNTVATAGDTVVMASTATGSAPLGYFWLFNGTNVVANAANLSLPNVQPAQAGAYRVVASNAAGASTSAVASLTVQVPPSIVTQPTNATVVAGAPVSFIAEAAGTAPIAYHWYFNATNTVGTNGPAFGLANAQPIDEGAYVLVVSNAAGTATSSVAGLTVLTPPQLTLQPSNATSIVGQSLALHALAAGSAPLAYQWYFNDTMLVGTNGPDLGFASIQTTNEGAYTLVITNGAGAVTSSVATLTVLVPPTFTLTPTNTVASPGDAVLLSAAATGSAPLGYYWMFNGTNLLSAVENLSLTNVQPGQAGQYQVVATNGAGAVTSSVALLTLLTQPILLSPATDTNGAFTFMLSGDVGQNYLIEVSTNLENWNPAGTLSNATGQTPFIETNTTEPFRVYRARRIP
jgi:uncharacterized repeat protein (TIGR01451 family)